MQPRLASAFAFALALSQVALTPALAKEPASAFRKAAPQVFSTEDLQRYGLTAGDAQAVQDQQAQGRQVVVLTQEEAAQYRAGALPGMWWIVGGVVLVVAVIAIANN